VIRTLRFQIFLACLLAWLCSGVRGQIPVPNVRKIEATPVTAPKTTPSDKPPWIDITALGVSLVTLLSTAGFALVNFRREKLNQRIQYFTFRQQYFTDLRTWATAAVNLLSDAVHFAELDPARVPGDGFFQKRNTYRAELSALIDRGRWFFPNLHSGEHGKDKERAFQGYRHDVLNALVAGYEGITHLDYGTGVGKDVHREEIVRAKRIFVSVIQEIVDPAKQDEEFIKITRYVLRMRNTRGIDLRQDAAVVSAAAR
jgi:hypothetical protein